MKTLKQVKTEATEKYILDIIAEHKYLSITRLAYLMGISTGTTIYNHIRLLEKSKKIILVKEVGFPIYLKLTEEQLE